MTLGKLLSIQDSDYRKCDTLYLHHSDTLTRPARGCVPTYYKLSDGSFRNQAPGGVFTSHATKSHNHPLHLSLFDTGTLQLFFNAHIKSHIDYASEVWGGCSDALKKRLNSLLRRSGKLILRDKNLTTDKKLNKIGILTVTNNWSTTRVFLCIEHLTTMCQ